MVLVILWIVIAPLFFGAGSVNAQNYPWCTQGGDGQVNCGFVSEEQCRAASRSCYRNPMYEPPSEQARSRRATRQRR
jgi:hypothetical protein